MMCEVAKKTIEAEKTLRRLTTNQTSKGWRNFYTYDYWMENFENEEDEYLYEMYGNYWLGTETEMLAYLLIDQYNERVDVPENDFYAELRRDVIDWCEIADEVILRCMEYKKEKDNEEKEEVKDKIVEEARVAMVELHA
jgi:hypothetical protein